MIRIKVLMGYVSHYPPLNSVFTCVQVSHESRFLMSLFPSLRLSEGQQLLFHKLVHYSSVQCLIKHIVDSNFKKIISIYVKNIFLESST